MSCCKICKSETPCGCKDTALTMPPNFITDPTICPDPNPCSEIFDAQCICYSGDELECDGWLWTIEPGTNVQTVIQTLFNALCEVANAGGGGGASTFNVLTPRIGDDNADVGTLNGYLGVIEPGFGHGSIGGLDFQFDRVGCADPIVMDVSTTNVNTTITFDESGTTQLIVPPEKSYEHANMSYVTTEAMPITIDITFTYTSCTIVRTATGFLTMNS